MNMSRKTLAWANKEVETFLCILGEKDVQRLRRTEPYRTLQWKRGIKNGISQNGDDPHHQKSRPSLPIGQPMNSGVGQEIS
ncbi:unnamed protein product [Boreogadus saida]